MRPAHHPQLNARSQDARVVRSQAGRHLADELDRLGREWAVELPPGTPTRLAIHPLAVDLFPSMTDDEFRALIDDIRAHGQREPITIHEGAVLDGVHRLMAVEQLGIEPLTKEWDGVGSVVEFMVSANLRRRHLDEGQRAMVAAKIANLPEGRPRETLPNGSVPMSVAAAANVMQVSERSVGRARKVVKHGNPALVAAVEKGEVTLGAAERAVSFPADQQVTIAKEPRRATQPYRPRFGGRASPSEAVDRAIGSITSYVGFINERFASTPSLPADARCPSWAKQLRAARQSISRIISKCETHGDRREETSPRASAAPKKRRRR